MDSITYPSLTSAQPDITIEGAAIGIAGILVLLRMMTRLAVVRRVYWEDGAILIALGTFTVFSWAIMTTLTLTSLGKNKSISFTSVLESTKAFLIAHCAYILTSMFLKLSISLFYLRLLLPGKRQRWIRWTIYATLSLMSLMTVAVMCFDLLQCGPWNSVLEFALKQVTGKCVAKKGILIMGYASGLCVVITDIVLAALPYFILRASSLPSQRERLVVTGLMMLGSLGCVCGIVRLGYVHTMAAHEIEIFAATTRLGLWSSLELSIGISAASLACLRPLLRRMHVPFSSHWTSLRGGSRSEGSHDLNTDSMLQGEPVAVTAASPHDEEKGAEKADEKEDVFVRKVTVGRLQVRSSTQGLPLAMYEGIQR